MDDWNKAYMELTGRDVEPEEAHWGWTLAGVVLAMVSLSLLAAWLIERLA